MDNKDDGKTGYDPSPINPLPAPVLVLAAKFFGIEVLLQAGAANLLGGAEAVGWRLAAAEQYGFFPQILEHMWQSGSYPYAYVIRFVTFPFIHTDFTHMLIATAIFLAMGKFVGELAGPIGVVIAFFASGAIGAGLYTAVFSDNAPILGSLPGAYGLMGTYTFLKWIEARLTGQNQWQAFQLLGFLAALQIGFAVALPGDASWIADLSAAVAGFLIAPFLFPVLRARLLRRMRGD